jgi:anti-sigma B factor antagonist
MSAWILRLPDKPLTREPSGPVTVLDVTAEGREIELEVLELGGKEVPGLRELVRGQIEKGRPHLILDLGSISRIDSGGLGDVVSTWQHAKNSGGELVLAIEKSRIREIFEIAYLDRVIPVFDSVGAAGRHFA